MGKHLPSVIIAAILATSLLVSCSQEPVKSDAVESPITVTFDGSTKGFSSLKEACDSVGVGKNAVIRVNKDIEISTLIEILDKDIVLMDGGMDVTITNKVDESNMTDGNGNHVAALFHIHGTGSLDVCASLGGSLTIRDGKASPEKRILFYVGESGTIPSDVDQRHHQTGSLKIEEGVTVTGVTSTIFGGIVRAYGKLAITGGTFKGNSVTGNGLFTLYSDDNLVSGGKFLGNTVNGSAMFEVCNNGKNQSGVKSTLLVTGGTFSGNSNTSSSKNGGIINSYANSVVTVSGGTFTGNKNSNSTGGIFCCLGIFNVTGGTFNGNSPKDIYIPSGAGDGVQISDKVSATVSDNR